MNEATKTKPGVGDFLVASWGYDQTNVDFYKIVGVTPSGKSVKIQEWSSKAESNAGPHDYMVPGEGPREHRTWWNNDGSRRNEVHVREAVIETKRLQSYGPEGGETFYVSLNSFSSAYVWDGKPKYQTGQGFGH